MYAATSPTRCFDAPLTTILVGIGTSNSIPTVTPAGTGIGCLPIRDIAWALAPADQVYQTCATTSPPTPWLRASWPVMTPFEVEMIEVPIPPWIRGMWAWSTYVRRPG